MFKDLKVGDLLYIIEVDSASGIPSYSTTSVISLTPEYTPSSGSILAAKVIDVVCQLGLENKTLSMIDPQSSSVSVANYKIGLEKDWAMGEIRKIHDSNKSVVASIEKCESIIAACAAILEKNGLSPKSDSQRLSSLEGSVASMRKDMLDIKSMISTLFNELNPEKDDTQKQDSDSQGNV